jgi:hypothetical protein
MSKNKHRKRGPTLYKVEPIFRDEDAETLVVGEETHRIEGKLAEFLVVSVPETTTEAKAIELEQKLTTLTKGQPVLVISHNIQLMRATPLTRQEKAELKNALKLEQTNAGAVAQ